ncbi:MAG: RDD family protein [Bacteroidota bacterium]
METPAPVLAGRWKRLGGALIDALISIVIIFPLMAVTGALPDIFSGHGLSFAQQMVWFVVGWAVFLAVNGYLLFKRGQTVGKVAVHTKIVDLEGGLPDFGKLLLLRYLVVGVVTQIPIIGGLFGLVNALFIFGEQKRCLHDYIAGTRVVEA